jgi:bifunctional UDP-N-acetylglucosamine pyrophosphorylase/glucosamine-1-phosphate N-acetyltransferase
MSQGITMHNPITISVTAESEISTQCILTQNITISGNTRIGTGCEIGPNVDIRKATIGSGVRIGANSVLINCAIDDNQSVPPGSIIDK